MLSSTPSRVSAFNGSSLRALASSSDPMDLMDEFVFGKSFMLVAPGLEPCEELARLYKLQAEELIDGFASHGNDKGLDKPNALVIIRAGDVN